MEGRELRDLETLFAQVEDPRVERTKLHRLRDIMITAICGVICGAEGWVEIEEFGKAKEAWFTDLLKLPNGIPSRVGIHAKRLKAGWDNDYLQRVLDGVN